MKNNNVVIISVIVLATGLSYGEVSVKDLPYIQSREKEMYRILSERWIDKAGDTHIGNKDPKELQFAFSETLLPKLTIQQIVDSMGAAVAKFPKAKQDAFSATVQPYLTDLKGIRLELRILLDQLNRYAATLAQYLQKPPEGILKMADANIRKMISQLPKQMQIEVDIKVDLEEFNELRRAFSTKKSSK